MRKIVIKFGKYELLSSSIAFICVRSFYPLRSAVKPARVDIKLFLGQFVWSTKFIGSVSVLTILALLIASKMLCQSSSQIDVPLPAIQIKAERRKWNL